MTFKSVLTMCALSAACCSTQPAASAADSKSAPLRTQIKLLTPFGIAGLSIGMAVTEEATGSCFTGSVASPSRPDAWRCSSGNGILAPCYQPILGDEKQLACPVAGPWPANVVLLTLTQPLPSEPRQEMSRENTLPWALELASGQHCTLFTGATAPVAGMRINCGCPGGFQEPGDIDRSQSVWRVFFSGQEIDRTRAGGCYGGVVLEN